MVHWKYGRKGLLTGEIPIKTLLQYADYLEVNEVKRVRWAV